MGTVKRHHAIEGEIAFCVRGVISPILASKMGFGLPSAASPGPAALDKTPGQMVAEVVPADQSFLQWQLARTAL